MTLPIRKPTAAEVEECDHVDLSTTSWDPRKEFDIVPTDEDSLVDTAPTADFDPANMLNVESKEQEPDWDWLRGCLLNKPLEVVKATWNATTKYAVNYSPAYPLNRHFKSGYPALNVRGVKEMFATDTFFSSVRAIGGATCVQVYVGVTTDFTRLYSMTSESEFER